MDDINSVSKDIENVTVSDSIACSPEDILSYTKSGNISLKILHLNIRSINCNFSNLLILLKRINMALDIIVLSECWLSKCPQIPVLNGYDHFETDFTNQNDGVVTYIRSGIHYNIELPNFVDANCIIIKLSNDTSVLAMYRPPSYKNISPFLKCLDSTLNALKASTTTVIVGDININLIPSDTDHIVDDYLNLVASHAMLPAHFLPTRENHCLDHIILRTPAPATTFVLDSLITDHAPILLCCCCKVDENKTKRFTQRLDVSSIVRSLEDSDFSFVFNSSDPEIITNALVSNISKIVEQHSLSYPIPSRKRIIKPWITPGLLKCIRHRDKLSRIARRDPDSVTNKIIYIRYRSFCNNLLKRIKSQFEQYEFSKAKKSPKDTWNIIKKIANIEKSHPNAFSLLKTDVSPKTSVNAVNNYFANVGRNLALNIERQMSSCTSSDKSPHQPSLGLLQPAPKSMALLSVDEKEIENIILNLKDKCALGWDGIPTSVIKSARHVLIPILKHVFNVCLSKGVFPLAFKKAVVHPIYKGGDRGSASNYRPISVLTVLSKVFEKILNKRLLLFIDKGGVLSENQYGFRSGRSTEDAVLVLTETVIRNFEKKQKTVGIFLDLSKAFDTVSIPILLSKLERIGVRGVVLDMFRSYLNSRTQCVVIDGVRSVDEYVSFGVPQGSVLGPSLFLIYINDLCGLSLPNCNIISYADDTALLVHGSSWEEASLLSETALGAVMNWLCANLLTLNVSKTKFITFSPGVNVPQLSHISLRAHICSAVIEHDQIPCDCTCIERTNCLKYLGVMIDCALSWRPHIEVLVSRIRKLIFVFKSLRKVVDFQCLKTVYFALAQSILAYCITSWGGTFKTHMLKIERAQRAVLKVITNNPYFYPTTELYKLCEVLTVRQLFVIHCVLRRHSLLYYDPLLKVLKRRYDIVCKIVPRRTAAASRHFCYISSTLYNRLHKQLDIYSLTRHKCKLRCTKWLQSLSYDDTEELFVIAS